MRVVSQDKDYSFEFDHRDVMRDENVILVVTNTGYKSIGKYESEEKAIKVFEDMHVMAENECNDFRYLSYTIFNMPQED